ncbi:hypothetical protein ACFX1T_000050 [Malus domestica]
MAFSSLSLSTTPSTTTCSLHSKRPHHLPLLAFHSNQHLFPLSISLPSPPSSTPARLRISLCAAAKSQTGPVKKRAPSPTNDNKKKKRKGGSGGGNSEDLSFGDVEIVDSSGGGVSNSRSLGFHPTPLPNPPAGFVVDDHGKVLMASSKRIASIVDPTNNFPLECVIRRVFRSSRGDECMLLCPVDTPVQILKSTNIDGWSAWGRGGGGHKKYKSRCSGSLKIIMKQMHNWVRGKWNIIKPRGKSKPTVVSLLAFMFRSLGHGEFHNPKSY